MSENFYPDRARSPQVNEPEPVHVGESRRRRRRRREVSRVARQLRELAPLKSEALTRSGCSLKLLSR